MSDKNWKKIWSTKGIFFPLLSFARQMYSAKFISIIGTRLCGETTFLEVGSGSGVFTIDAAKIAKKAEGIDIAPQAVAIAKRNAKAEGSKANFMVANCYKMPFNPGSFSIVWSQGVL
ncbi:MAG: class I SAM-dependent methyltransferase, partial [archaeon]|nr:class I SAM-dependent methyltransferase [archaeon]